MKRIAVISIVIGFVLSLCTTVFASSTTYRVDELGLNVSIPDKYSVVTRSTSADDPIFERLGISKLNLDYQFELSNIYLNAVSSDLSEEIVVTMIQSTIRNFNLLSDTTLSEWVSEIENEYNKYNTFISKYEVYQQEQAKFIKIYFEDTGQPVYGLQYYTVYENKAINFTIRSYSGAITSLHEETIKSIADSVRFDAEVQSTDEAKNTGSGIYEDIKCGIKFTVPEDWVEKPLSKKREFIDVKFVSTQDEDLCMMFGAANIWEMMSDSERDGYTQAEFDDSQVSVSYIADILDLDDKSIIEKNIMVFIILLQK